MTDLGQKYYSLYMKNMVTQDTMRKLVAAGKLAEEEFNKTVSDRLTLYGY